LSAWLMWTGFDLITLVRDCGELNLVPNLAEIREKSMAVNISIEVNAPTVYAGPSLSESDLKQAGFRNGRFQMISG